MMNLYYKVVFCLLLMFCYNNVCIGCNYSNSDTTPLLNFKDHVTTSLNFDNCIILAEQSENRIAIVNLISREIVWQWKAKDSNVKPEHFAWFNAPSDAKVVYNGNYLLMTASGGGVALIRIRDKKAVFYAYAGGNTHSIELLPDGNIVSASSTGNYLTVFKTDTIVAPDAVQSTKIKLRFGHNLVWDNKRQILWTAASNHLFSFRYNFICNKPDLVPIDSVSIPGTVAHDLFPVFNEDALWLTTTEHVFKFHIVSKEFQKIGINDDGNIKSLSSGTKDLPVIIIRPKEQWWTDEVFDTNNQSVFKQEGFKIYKARWFVQNAFSYEKNNIMHLCK